MVLAGLGPNGAACRSSDTALAGCAMSATKRALDRAQQARLRYEHAATSARHDRDAEISAAWLRFERNTAEAWAEYQKAMAPVEAAMQADLAL